MFLLLACVFCKGKNEDPLITQELVDRINNNPHSPFKAKLHPEFASLTLGEAKKFLYPVRKSPTSSNHGSPLPVGANEKHYIKLDKRVFTGFYLKDGSVQPHSSTVTTSVTPWSTTNKYTYTVYDNKQNCASWALAVTSAMSLALSIHHKKFVNLSVQFILDCDLFGDPCMARPPTNAYEQFWRRYIPQADRWDQPAITTRTPHKSLTRTVCDAKAGCYPGWTNCPRNLVMTGSCDAGNDINCPIYYLYNWRWMKSHLWEVGPVTSSLTVTAAFFTYSSGVYSQYGAYTAGAIQSGKMTKNPEDVIGMLDVTIIGWGQKAVNLSQDRAFNTGMYNRWWYVIPHLGKQWGETCGTIFGELAKKDSGYIEDSALGSIQNFVECGGENDLSGIMRINRRFDDCSIESQSVGAVPFNFVPGRMKKP